MVSCICAIGDSRRNLEEGMNERRSVAADLCEEVEHQKTRLFAPADTPGGASVAAA